MAPFRSFQIFFVGLWLLAQVAAAQNTGARGMVAFGRSAGLPGDTLLLDVNQDIAAQLLPFDQLMKMALAYSPLVKYQRATIEVAEASTNVTKAQILQNLNGFANYSWGNQSLVTTGIPDRNNALGQLANGYRVGVDARISLYDLFGRKHQIQQAQANQKAATLQVGVIELQVRQQLINVYQDMITTQQVLKFLLLDEQASLTAYRLAELDMQKGRITATAMAAITTQYVQARTNSEQAKGNFLKNVHFFEALMGVPVQRLKRI